MSLKIDFHETHTHIVEGVGFGWVLNTCARGWTTTFTKGFF